MVKRILKRILVFSSVACLVLACVPSFSFAIDPVSGAAALAGALDAYGMAYGVGTVYDVSSSSGVSSSFEGLWDDFSEYQSNSGSQFDYDSYLENYNQNRSLYGFAHSSGKFAAWSIDAESAEIFDQFWNWLLTGPAEMTRVDNEYFQFSQSQIGPDAIPIHIVTYGGLAGYTLAALDSSWDNDTRFSNSTVVSQTYFQGNVYRTDKAGFLSNPDYPSNYVYGFVYGSDPYRLCFCCLDNHHVGYWGYRDTRNNLTGNQTYNNFTTSSGLGFYYVSSGPIISNGRNSLLPLFPTLQDGLNTIKPFLVDGETGDSIGIKAFSDSGISELPNPYGQDYVPTPLEIVTNVPWDSTYDDTDEEDGSPVPFPPVDVPLVVDDILTSISAEDYALEEDPQDPDPDPPPPAPSEVFVPLLPVGLPSFNFSFSGIWHYVREWVASLGAWFTTLFSIWGALPYAMVVPVYATAVVVIVLGVYKRFFM